MSLLSDRTMSLRRGHGPDADEFDDFVDEPAVDLHDALDYVDFIERLALP
jgi:hypothetical protein